MEITLEQDEQIIIRTPEIRWISDMKQKLDDFILTNKGLYCCYTQKNGLFSKPEPVVYRFELSDIVTEESYSHIEQVKAQNERCIQIEFRHGMEHFSFQRVPKKAMDDWLGAFERVLEKPDFTKVQRARNKEMLNNLAGDVVEGVSTIIGAGSKVLLDKIGQMTSSQPQDRNQSQTQSRSQARTRSRSQTQSRSQSQNRSQTQSRNQNPDQNWNQSQTSNQEQTTRAGGNYEYTYYKEVTDIPSRSAQTQEKETERFDTDSQAIYCVHCGAKLYKGTVYCHACGTKVAEVAEEEVEKKFYLAIDGQPKGPFEMEEIRELARSGQINRATLAWTKGMENWKPMEENPELKVITEDMPPVLF